VKQRSFLQKSLIALVVFVFLASLLSHAKDARDRHKGVLAIVHVGGPIQFSNSPAVWSSTDAEDIAKKLHELSEDDDVKAIVLRINSPGGTVGSVQEISEEIGRCRAKGKKVVASMGDVAASGGYYLAAASDHILANPGTITGSIGVILEFGNLEGLFQKVGLKVEVIKSGAHKDIGSPARPLTAEETRMLQASIDDAYAQFLDAVSQGRHLSHEQLKNIADGRIFTGRQAMQIGLVDELGNQEDAIQAAIRLAKLPAKPVIDGDDRKSFSSFLQRATSQLSHQPLEAIQDVVSGTSVEYRWRP
jgi:protease-4